MKYYKVHPYDVMEKLMAEKEIYVTDHRNGVTRSLNKLSTEITLQIIAVAKQENDRPYESDRIDRFMFWYKEKESEDESNEHDAVSDERYSETVAAVD